MRIDPPPSFDPRAAIRALTYADEAELARALTQAAGLDPERRQAIAGQAAALVTQVRTRASPSMMEAFLAEYGLSTDEGVGLMCLAEALLRVPDAPTIDELIADKIEPSNWGAHLGKSSSSLVNAATWGLMLTGRMLNEDPARPAAALRGLLRRLGEPVVRTAVGRAIKLMGGAFVLGETIVSAMDRARALEARGYTYSYDMLGEAARTEFDAARYARAYADAIAAVAGRATGDVRTSPGVSVKLSALHPRYEWSHRAAVMAELAPRACDLARMAASANIGFSIDAEEADRLDLSLDVVEALLADPELAGWDGFGVAVQAYGRRAPAVIDWLHALSVRLDRRIAVRLVKGAYWDAEIKAAQERGLPSFPVFTRKATTDLSYLACARQLLDMRDRIYPQFATHNAHTVAAIRAMAEDARGVRAMAENARGVRAMAEDAHSFEFQRLHGMGEALHELVLEAGGPGCRIYAPVGAHRDLLAYLVRRLLENGANSSFVNQVVDADLAPETIAADPIAAVARLGAAVANSGIAPPARLFAPRVNAAGWNVNEPASIAPLIAAREAWRTHRWTAAPARTAPNRPLRTVVNPADPLDVVGEVSEASDADIAAALAAAEAAFPAWAARAPSERAAVLRAAADLFEANAPELTALVTREAGKTLADAIAELREAVDFLRYYGDATEAATGRGRGVIVAISPWNFPLAIFTGQVAAALGAGCAVLAKPAEQTPLTAARAVELLHAAGAPPDALLLLPGDGPGVGGPLTAAPGIAGVVFTGSTDVARSIHRALAANAAPGAVLIAETGGLNAMIVDTTALTEQVVRDVLASAFQSAGQRCSALRMLYVQDEAKPRVLEMLEGAMAALTLGDPWDPATDVGPLIDADAETGVRTYIAEHSARVVKSLPTPSTGRFAPPTMIAVRGIADLDREIFGPVLHVAGFAARDLDRVVAAVNARGYGLTFALHSRIDARVERVTSRIRAGNIYVNRNQIGAVVGSQPFGGEGLSGTGPKAGGPHYLPRLQHAPEAVPDADTPDGPPAGRTEPQAKPEAASAANPPSPAAAAHTQPMQGAAEGRTAAHDSFRPALRGSAGGGPPDPPAPVRGAHDIAAAFAALDAGPWAGRPDRIAELRKLFGAHPALDASAGLPDHPQNLPGPTGESNRYALHPRGRVLALGAAADDLIAQTLQALAAGDPVLAVAPRAPRALAPLLAAGLPLAALDGGVDPAALTTLADLGLVAARGPTDWLRALRLALAARPGAIVGLETSRYAPAAYALERHLCIDTTAAGGNASLLATGGVASSAAADRAATRHATGDHALAPAGDGGAPQQAERRNAGAAGESAC